MIRPHAVTAIAVGVPARNEAALVGSCIASIDEAASLVPVPVHLVVVDDASDDGTAQRARRALASAGNLSGEVITRRCGTAGIARAAAIDAALDAVGSAATVWVATTDADSTVGAIWLDNQMAWASRGVGAITGLVEVDWEVESRHLAAQHLASQGHIGIGHGHVHGANFGLLASHWRDVGGCGNGGDGEDHELRRRLVAIGIDVLGVDDLPVLTSGRLQGRAPAGFSGYLRGLVAVVGPASEAAST